MPPTDTPKTWLITGASRGMGVHFAEAALAAGHQVIATARTSERVTEAIGAHERLLAVRLDVTDPPSVDQAVAAGVEHFGSIDVLVNNAGNFYGGFFEELSPAQVRSQIETNLVGPMTAARPVLPAYRRQRAWLDDTRTSLAVLLG